MALPDHAVRCASGPRGYRYLEVSALPAPGPAPLDLHDRRPRAWNLGLHGLDLQWMQDDLIEMISRRVARLL